MGGMTAWIFNSFTAVLHAHWLFSTSSNDTNGNKYNQNCNQINTSIALSDPNFSSSLKTDFVFQITIMESKFGLCDPYHPVIMGVCYVNDIVVP